MFSSRSGAAPAKTEVQARYIRSKHETSTPNVVAVENFRAVAEIAVPAETLIDQTLRSPEGMKLIDKIWAEKIEPKQKLLDALDNARLAINQTFAGTCLSPQWDEARQSVCLAPHGHIVNISERNKALVKGRDDMRDTSITMLRNALELFDGPEFQVFRAKAGSLLCGFTGERNFTYG